MFAECMTSSDLGCALNFHKTVKALPCSCYTKIKHSGVQRCQITEVIFYTKVLIHDILVGLERILDYAGIRLERFNCNLKLHV